MAKRKTISKKLRFEVFKRDSFTCQYCGQVAPNVILEVDHINPVKNSGDNNILNLITSCKDCNRGKGARELTDSQIIKQQHEQLAEINEKREQLKLMLKWKEELENFNNEQVEIIEKIMINYSNFTLTEHGKKDILKHIKKYGMSEVIESTHISFKNYFDGNVESCEKAINYIPRICYVRLRDKDNPFFKEILYIKGILKNRITIYDDAKLNKALRQIIISQEDVYTVQDIAKSINNWSQFWREIDEIYEGDW
jgi:hypothetical protein